MRASSLVVFLVVATVIMSVGALAQDTSSSTGGEADESSSSSGGPLSLSASDFSSSSSSSSSSGSSSPPVVPTLADIWNPILTAVETPIGVNPNGTCIPDPAAAAGAQWLRVECSSDRKNVGLVTYFESGCTNGPLYASTVPSGLGMVCPGASVPLRFALQSDFYNTAAVARVSTFANGECSGASMDTYFPNGLLATCALVQGVAPAFKQQRFSCDAVPNVGSLSVYNSSQSVCAAGAIVSNVQSPSGVCSAATRQVFHCPPTSVSAAHASTAFGWGFVAYTVAAIILVSVRN